jgi:hypothetical protein
MSEPVRQNHLSNLELRRALVALVVGWTLAMLPRFTSDLNEYGVVGLLKLGIQCLMLPGAVLGMLVAGNIHGVSILLVETTNAVFYSGLLYALLTALRRRKAKH